VHGKSPNRARLVRYGAEPADPGHHYRSRRSGAWEREHLVEEVQPEQILSLHPEFNAPIAEHDRRLPPLTEACLRLQEALLESRALREAFDRVASATPPDKKLAEYLGGLDPQDHLKFIAENMRPEASELLYNRTDLEPASRRICGVVGNARSVPILASHSRGHRRVLDIGP
jgi:hypothetical protein